MTFKFKLQLFILFCAEVLFFMLNQLKMPGGGKIFAGGRGATPWFPVPMVAALLHHPRHICNTFIHTLICCHYKKHLKQSLNGNSNVSAAEIASSLEQLYSLRNAMNLLIVS